MSASGIATGLGDDKLADRFAADDVLLDDSFEYFRRTSAVPYSVGHHDHDRPADANAEALSLNPGDAQTGCQLQFLQSTLEKSPSLRHLSCARAFLFFMVRTNQNGPQIGLQSQFLASFPGRSDGGRFQN